MTPRKTPALDELAAHEQRVAEADTRIREVEQQAQNANAEAERIREELVEACSVGDRALEAKLTKAKRAAEDRAAEPWAERIAGAQRAAQRAEVEHDTWRIENIRPLLEEMAPDAQRVT